MTPSALTVAGEEQTDDDAFLAELLRIEGEVQRLATEVERVHGALSHLLTEHHAERV